MIRRWAFLMASVCVFALGCQPTEVADQAPDGSITVIGRLISVKDDRPADGGVDLTIETRQRTQEILRVGSAFIAGPREHVLALHAVVDASKVGDRLRATGRRDESGVIIVEKLEKLD